MSSPAVATLVKMMEALPETAQNRVVEHLRDYIADLEDALKGEAQLELTQPQHELRPYGLCAGEFRVPDDFDAPLPEELLIAFEG